MADYEDDEYEPPDYGELSREDQQDFLYDLIGFRDEAQDSEARQMFFDLMYNDDLDYADRLSTYENLSAHLWEMYGMDFEAIWDWADFREWYESA